MGLLTSLFERQRQTRSLENPSTPLSADDGVWDTLGGSRASSGTNVNRETALTYSTWWRLINLVSSDVAKLPVHVYRHGERGKEKDPRHRAYYLLRKRPNREMHAFTWKRVMVYHKLAEGNGYSYIDRSAAGEPLELIPLPGTRTYPVRADGQLYYVTELKSGEQRRLLPENVLHFKGLSYDGLIGYNVLRKARESLGLALAGDSYGSIFFRSHGAPGVVLQTPHRLNPEARKNLRESWERMHAGLENAHKTAILEEGLEAKPFSLSAKDAQLLESRRFSKAEMCDWFGAPPSKAGLRESQSYNTLEQEDLAYLGSCIDPILVEFESECDLKLLTEHQQRQDTHAVEFHRKALIRMDAAARSSYFHNAVQDGWLCDDEVRGEEGYNPKPEGAGKVFRVPANMVAQKGGATAEADPTPAGTQTPGELLEVPDVRQQDHYSCGAACAMAVGRYFGVGPATLEEWKAALGTDVEQSTRPAAIADYLTRLGLKVTAGGGLTVGDLRRFWAAGQPVICPVQDYGAAVPGGADFAYGHYLVVIGAALGHVFCQDPSADNVLEGSASDAAPGRVMITEEDWLARWHDKDSDGNAYLQFGIAAGRELLPATVGAEQDTEEEEGPDDETQGGPGEPVTVPDQPAGDAGRDGPARAVASRWLADVAGRVVRRVGVHARRAAKEPARFLAWLEAFTEGQRGPVRASFATAEGAAGVRAALAADLLLAHLARELLEVSGAATSAQLPGAIEARLAALEAGPWSFAGQGWRCGGPGSGVPGPCPEGKEEKAGEKEGPKLPEPGDWRSALEKGEGTLWATQSFSGEPSAETKEEAKAERERLCKELAIGGTEDSAAAKEFDEDTTGAARLAARIARANEGPQSDVAIRFNPEKDTVEVWVGTKSPSMALVVAPDAKSGGIRLSGGSEKVVKPDGDGRIDPGAVAYWSHRIMGYRAPKALKEAYGKKK